MPRNMFRRVKSIRGESPDGGIKGVSQIQMIMKNTESLHGDRRALSMFGQWRDKLSETPMNVTEHIVSVPRSTIDNMPKMKTSEPIIQSLF